MSDRADDRIDDAQATRLLHLGLEESESPIDDLLMRLTLPGGEAWFQSMLDRDPLMALRHAVEGGATPQDIERVQEAKHASKSVLRGATSNEQRAHATLGYFVAQAYALVHHDQWLSSVDRPTMVRAFADLAAVTPEAWSRFFTDAIHHTSVE